MSRADIACPSSGQPVAFRNVLLARPISRARRFISSANAASLPEMPSAMTMEASLPDCTMMPRNRSATLTRVLTMTNILDPPMRHAFSLTRNLSSRLSAPALSRSNTRYVVISLLIDAGGMPTSAAFSSNTVPVVASMMMA